MKQSRKHTETLSCLLWLRPDLAKISRNLYNTSHLEGNK